MNQYTPPANNLPATQKQSGLLATGNHDESIYTQAKEAAGTNNLSADKITIPGIIITDKQNQATKDQQEGLIFNTVTDVAQPELNIIPLKMLEGFHIVEYDQSQNKENIVDRVNSEAELPPDTHHKPGTSYKETKDGLRVYPILECYCLDEDMNICKVLFKKSKFKVGKKFATQLKLAEIKRPACSYVYKLSTVQEIYNNHSYFNFKLTKVGDVNPEIFNEALEWYKNVDTFIKDDQRNGFKDEH